LPGGRARAGRRVHGAVSRRDGRARSSVAGRPACLGGATRRAGGACALRCRRRQWPCGASGRLGAAPGPGAGARGSAAGPSVPGRLAPRGPSCSREQVGGLSGPSPGALPSSARRGRTRRGVAGFVGHDAGRSWRPRGQGRGPSWPGGRPRQGASHARGQLGPARADLPRGWSARGAASLRGGGALLDDRGGRRARGGRRGDGPVVSTKFGEVIGLPEPKPDTVYVVSALVASAVRRRDVLSPGSLVRDKEGRVVGAASFVLQEGSA
jgi:hypothetical protein